jgi:chemotaxis protein methyltransferase CheR
MLTPAELGMTGTLSDKHFWHLSELIESSTGIRLPPNKRSMVEGRLRKRLKALCIPRIDEYCALIFDQGALSVELPHLIDCMTTNKTDFFREPSHFEILRSHILPEILSGSNGTQGRHVKVWSAAASIGAEAYTIAMVLDQELRNRQGAKFSILGTDISTDVLRQAQRAIYPLEMMVPVPYEMQGRYLMRARDPRRREVRIVPELRRAVEFRHLNLVEEKYPVDRDMDIIFCRNILIYFSKPVQDNVVRRLISHLRPGGYLILGHSESMAGGAQRNLVQAFPTVYRRIDSSEEQKQCPQPAKRRSAS